MKVICMDVSEPPQAPLLGLRLLVVEDEILIALSVEDMLLDAGAREIIVATRANDAAMHLTAATGFDAAVIDLNLGTGFDFSLAELAQKRGIPTVLATGYGQGVVLPTNVANAVILNKPFTNEMMISALLAAMKRWPTTSF
jgi:DNA-binding NtrC family response regulator